MAWIIGRSDGHCELVESLTETVAGGDVSSDLLVAAAQMLHERVTGGQDPRGPVMFEAAHRPQPGLQSTVIGLDRFVRVAFSDVQRRGPQRGSPRPDVMSQRPLGNRR
jgi:hypothetical protein